MKKTLFVILIFIIFKSEAFSTPQASDLIIVGNDTLPLYSLPLENYLVEKNLSADIFDQFGFSTACWRYYRAIWKILNDSLYLQELVSCVSDTIKIPLQLIFNNDLSNRPIFAYWVTDTVWAEIGNQIYYIHEGWGNIYDKEKCFIVNQGVVKETNVFDYSDKYFISELNVNVYIYDIYCNKIDWNKIPISKNEIKIIVFLSNDTSYVIKNISNAEKIYEDEALRIVRDFKTTKLFQFNKEVKLSFGIPIVFSKAIKENCNK
jgi:hypothetical protein